MARLLLHRCFGLATGYGVASLLAGILVFSIATAATGTIGVGFAGLIRIIVVVIIIAALSYEFLGRAIIEEIDLQPFVFWVFVMVVVSG